MRQAQSLHWDSWDQELIRREKVKSKLDRIQTLKALLETWETREHYDHDYVVELRAKLRQAENQYKSFSL